MENTDEEHQATTNDLVSFLRREDANASRKTVKDDIEVLIEEGADIVTTKSYYNSYFIGSRRFEIPEVKMMIDGIADSIKQGYIVDLGVLGKLYPAVSGTWKQDPDELAIGDMKPKVNYKPGDDIAGAVKAARLSWTTEEETDDNAVDDDDDNTNTGTGGNTGGGNTGGGGDLTP